MYKNYGVNIPTGPLIGTKKRNCTFCTQSTSTTPYRYATVWGVEVLAAEHGGPRVAPRRPLGLDGQRRRAAGPHRPARLTDRLAAVHVATVRHAATWLWSNSTYSGATPY